MHAHAQATTLLLAALAASVAADGLPSFVVPGNCAKITPMKNFNLQQVS